MNRYLIFITLLASFLFSNQKYAYNNKLLFCLNKDIDILELDQTDGFINTNIPSINNLLERIHATSIEPWLPGATEDDYDGDIYLNRIYRIHMIAKEYKELENIKNEVSNIKEVHSCEFEYKRKPYYTPNDSNYNNQWYLPAINSNDAWDYWTELGNIPGNRNIILASVDTGVNWTHADLRNNLWENLGEDADGDGRTIEGSGNNWYLDPGDLNGIDDDDWDNNHNTYIDDLIGWDPAGLGGLDDNNPDPPNSGGWTHGTHVAGLLAASSDNNNGIASTCFNCSIMSVKVSDENQTSDIYITDGFAGILYAAKAGFYSEGFSIINNSWGGGGYSLYENAVIDECVNDYNAIIVCAGGNGSTTGWGEANEPHYPSSYENSVAVCPLGNNNQWNHWGTYHETMDLASPGESIRSSTNAPNSYSSWDGSSMASPVAASVFGLLKSYHQNWNNDMIKTMVLATADPIIYQVNSENYLQGMLGNGRVDALQAISTPLFPKIEYVGEDIVILNSFDEIINPGEQIELTLILINNPLWGNAINASAILLTNNIDITISNSYVEFGNIIPGDVGMNVENPFLISFDENISIDDESLDIEFVLEFSSNLQDYVEYKTSIPIILTLQENTIILGDLNQDSIINILDVVQLVNVVLGASNPSSYQLQAGDMNGDEILNIQDIVILINLILG